MTKKQILRCAIFAVILCMVMVVLCDLYEHENVYNFDRRFCSYRSFNEDTIDGVFIGTSGVDRYWVAAKAYEDYGMTVYPLSSERMPAWLYPTVIDEVYTHQNPELLIIDTRPFGQDNCDFDQMDVSARRVLDGMEFFSWNRIKGAFATMENMHASGQSDKRFEISYLLSFVKFHSIWEEKDYRFSSHIGSLEHPYAGFYVNKNWSLRSREMEDQVYNPAAMCELDGLSEKALYDVIEYIREHNINALFVDTPRLRTEDEMGRANRVYKILEEEGMKYLHFYSGEEGKLFSMDLDLTKDFYNSSHVNYYGAEKFTDVFAAYLNQNYDLPDRRNDPEAQEYWKGIYKRLGKLLDNYAEQK